MPELWGMQSTTSLLLLPGPLQSGVGAPDTVVSMTQIELNCVLTLNWIVWNRTDFDIETAYLCENELFEIKLFWYLTVCKQKNYTFTNLNCLK